jgi:hypothetical protein
MMTVTGCTDKEKTETLSTLQTGLSDLTQNKSLVEQFVRDVKANVDPASPAYQQALDSYDTARDSYNHFLDLAESGENSQKSRSLRLTDSSLDARNAAADFLLDATVALKPSVATRRIPFMRAVVIPEDLQKSLHSVSKRSRDAIVDRFDKQIRWHSWGQL